MNSSTPAPAAGVQAWHQAALDQGRFLIQRGTVDGRHVYYPREFSPFDGSVPEWVVPRGTGTVYAVTTVRRKPEAGGDYNVSIVELDEGVRLMSRVENIPPTEVKIGLRVKARVQVADGRGLVVFDPSGDAA
ncbi:Zn-ribbon domain-containing OB-fold protein [Variovorax sp. UMC13]|uniref:Zn-ribbon domain-containing OB-fold protein n=1 Tax=Variovorax sp. UMC13 TaxID=1862326 RepID=UPI001602E757|nr:OB-fold domain-containing protein [Variovorax sp. UMC13]MBB1603776.1 DNA-binding protein [Variovorax sp. UMC13]